MQPIPAARRSEHPEATSPSEGNGPCECCFMCVVQNGEREHAKIGCSQTIAKADQADGVAKRLLLRIAETYERVADRIEQPSPDAEK